MRNLMGFVGGVAFAAMGLRVAPASPAYDPKGWGPCGVSAVFPIRLPESAESATLYGSEMVEHPFGFDHSYLCEMKPHTWVMLAVYLAATFMISGAVATRIGQTVAPTRGVLAAAPVAAVAIIYVGTSVERFDVLATTIVGIVLFASAICCAFLGGHLAQENA